MGLDVGPAALSMRKRMQAVVILEATLLLPINKGKNMQRIRDDMGTSPLLEKGMRTSSQARDYGSEFLPQIKVCYIVANIKGFPKFLESVLKTRSRTNPRARQSSAPLSCSHPILPASLYMLTALDTYPWSNLRETEQR
jgi:hypothetical protein